MGDAPVVLVVEDEWLLRDCISAHLRAARWRVLEARTGAAALAHLQARRPIDVLFTDIQLAGPINGWQVGASFREALPQIPVIYTSGEASRSDLAVPESLFVAKPYDPDVIVGACRSLIGGGGRQ